MEVFYQDIDDNLYKREPYGWSSIEIFNENLEFLKGRHKLPFYSTSNQLNTYLCVKLALPADQELCSETRLNPL